jgi:hypothetical protein
MVNFRRTFVRPNFVELWLSRLLSASHSSTWSSRVTMSGRSSSEHPRCTCASALLAQSFQLSWRGGRAKLMQTGRSLTALTILLVFLAMTTQLIFASRLRSIALSASTHCDDRS